MDRDGAQLSRWAVRQRLEAKRLFVRDDQLDQYVNWGLLPNPSEDDKWPATVLCSIVRIHGIAKIHRRLLPLPRRVVYLRKNYFKFPVPAEKVRNAMIEMCPSIDASYRKIRRVHASMQRWNRYAAISSGEALPTGLRRGRGRAPDPWANHDLRADWRPPKRDLWQEVLRDPTFNGILETNLGTHYRWLRMMADLGRRIRYDLDDIPLEERVLLLTVLEFAQMQEARRNYARSLKS